jgi:UDP-N-acetylglucosamine acyltransferase
LIHPSSVIDPGSQLGEQVEIGPFAVIGAGVEIGDRTVIGSHTVLEGPTRIGCDNIIAPFCSLGGPPQDKKYAGDETTLVIGDRNTVREYCTFNRGTVQGGGTTEIGNDNWIMAYVHLAHDCVIGSNVVFANGATLAGHVTVGDGTTLGAFTVVHQFCAIGQSAFTAMGTVVFKDIPPFVTASGNTASPHGIPKVCVVPACLKRRLWTFAARIKFSIKRASRSNGPRRSCKAIMPGRPILRPSWNSLHPPPEASFVNQRSRVMAGSSVWRTHVATADI